MEVVDITIFNNEIELLDLRINILQDVVDQFYIIEATETHQGQPKEILGNKYSHPKLKVVTIVFPEGMTNWERENYQRAYKLTMNPNSIVMTSDLDEVPDPKAVAWIRDNFNPGLVYAFEQKMHQYYLNVRNMSEPWSGTRLCSKEVYYEYNAEVLRWGKQSYPTVAVPDAGWHWSFLGGKSMIEKKIKEYAHAEYNNEETLSKIEQRLTNNEDVFNRGFILETVEIDDSYPEYVRNNQSKLAHLIKK